VKTWLCAPSFCSCVTLNAQGLDSSRKDLARKHDAVAEANRKQETAVAEEKKRREEQVRADVDRKPETSL
jgi:hypothetical protein